MEKKLYKSSTDKKISGVCAGIAEYLGTDATLIRLAWVLLSLAGGIGILPYIIAAIIIPERPANLNNGQFNNQFNGFDQQNGFQQNGYQNNGYWQQNQSNGFEQQNPNQNNGFEQNVNQNNDFNQQ